MFDDYFSQAVAQAQMGGQAVPQPTYLNVEYLFYQLLFLPQWLAELLSGYTGFNAFIIKSILVLLGALLLYGIVHSVVRIRDISKKEERRWKQIEIEAVRSESATDVTPRWEKVTSLLASPNEADWRLAILEADAMLDDLLTSAGYRGESVGDKLKSVEPSDFTTLSLAWEAHKVRNRIAHEGRQFVLTHREAKNMIEYYSRVFKEFRYI